MKKTIKTCALLTVTALFSVSCDVVKDFTNILDLKTQTMEDFSKGKTDYFTASHGWTNGSPFAVTWQNENVDYADDKMSLEIKKDGEELTGGELKSKDFFHYGSYSVKMKPMKIDGTASTFFTYTGPSDNQPWDEIDIEFLGKDTTKVQFNYFTNGKGNHEYMYDLGFDASLDYHEYGFRWTEESITWFVDKKPVHVATENIPTHPQRIMTNAWCGDATAKMWMGQIPSDFTSGKAYYEEIGFQDLDGKPYVPTFEIKPEETPEDAKWEDLKLEFASTEDYNVENNDGVTNVKYDSVANESYKNINAPLPASALKANAVELKIKNNGTKDADIRVDVNQNETVGNTRCVNKSAKQDGKEITTNLEWGGSSFVLKPGQESTIEVRYEGPATELMFMLDSFVLGNETRSGDITIKDIKLGTYGEGNQTPEEPEIPNEQYRDLDVDFNADVYTVTKNEKTHEVTYKDVAGNSYKNIAAPLTEAEKGHQKIKFTIKNNGEKLVKARADVNQAEMVGNTKAINVKATQDGKAIRTDFEWGGSFFDLDPEQESVIELEYKGEAVEFMIFLDSMTGTDELSSGNVTIKDIQVAKIEEEPTPEEPPFVLPEGAIEVDPTFTSDFANYKISKKGKTTTVNYEGVKLQTYRCINTTIDYQGKKSLSFKIKNNGDKVVKIKVDVIKENKSVNTSATFDEKEIYTDLVNGGSSLDLAANSSGVITINFTEEPTGLNIFLDTVYGEDKETAHSGNVSFSQFFVK